MKKYKGLIVSGGVLAIVLIAYFIITSIPQEVEQAPSSEAVTSTPEVNYLVKIDEENIKSVTIEAEKSFSINAESATVEDEDGESQTVIEYSLAEPKDVAYLTDEFGDAARALSRIMIDADPVASDNHSEYGLDTPAAVVTVNHSSGSTVYEVGDLAPGESDYYAKLADSDDVWLISASTAKYALEGEWQFRDKFLFGFAEGEEYSAVESFILEREGQETIELALLESAGDEFSSVYELIAPLNHDANDTVFVDSIVNNLSSLEYSDIIEDHPQDLEKYGIFNTADEQTEPAPESTDENAESNTDEVNDEAATVDEVIASNNQPLARITINDDLIITLGDFTDETESYYYASVSGIDSVVTFPASYFPYLDIKYVDLMSSLMWLHNIVDAESVNIATPSGEHTLVFNHMVNPDDEEDTWMEPTLDGEEIEEDFAKDIYLSLLSVTLSNIIEEDPEVGEIEYTLTINMLNSDSFTMEFYRINERQYGTIKDGQPLPFYVNIDLLTYIEQLIADIKSGVHES